MDNYYYNPNKVAFATENYTFPECVYAYCDLWFYTVGDVLYILRVLGFQIGYNGQCLYFINVNNRICPDVCKGDRIVDMYFDDSKNHVGISFINSVGTAIVTQINVPNFSTVQKPTEWKIIDSQTAYIKVFSFSNFDVQHISTIIESVKYLFIDLRDNMGGPINDMIKVLSLFSISDHIFSVEDSNGYIHSIKIKKSLLNLSNIKAINFRVNEFTASSAEMFVLTLRSLFPGRIYGDKTTGKLIVQDFVMVDNSMVAVPVYHFVLPVYINNDAVEIDTNNKIVPDVGECPEAVVSTFCDF